MIPEVETIIAQFLGYTISVSVGQCLAVTLFFIAMILGVCWVVYRFMKSLVRGVRAGWRQGKIKVKE